MTAKALEDGLQAYPWRFKFAVLMLALAFGVIGWRAIELHVLDQAFLAKEGNARMLRVEKVNAYRGMILDRNGEPLAVSTPVLSIWANPGEIEDAGYVARQLAPLLKLSRKALERRLTKNVGKEFIYLQRHLPPAAAEAVLDYELPGIYGQKEYRRYYPAGEVAAHLVGFTDIDDSGQEGMELAYEEWLRGEPGEKLVLKDRVGQVIKDLQSLKEEKPGQDMKLSIDLRLQYLAYRELKAAVTEHKAKSGSLILLDAKSGEVLALVNQPSYNPNKRSSINHTNLRNRAITDVFEPGSTVKPLTVAAALESGKFTAASKIDTSPGYMRLGRNTIRDHRNYGVIDLETLITKSSNIGASKLALALDQDALWNMFSQARLGRDTGSGFPGERVGLLPYHENWREVELATLSYGYGLSVTVLQLAQAYTAFANQGQLQPVSLLHSEDIAAAETVMLKANAQRVLRMMETVVSDKGTGSRAAISGYRVAGKTGTVHKLSEGGYQADKYLSLFAGIAPASNPRIVAVVLIDEPGGEQYYGGEVAAPVFSRVVYDALRVLNVAPDDLPIRSEGVADREPKSEDDRV